MILVLRLNYLAFLLSLFLLFIYKISALQVNDLTANTLPHMHADDLPQTAIVTFYHGSKIQSLDFHPVKQTLLLGLLWLLKKNLLLLFFSH